MGVGMLHHAPQALSSLCYRYGFLYLPSNSQCFDYGDKSIRHSRSPPPTIRYVRQTAKRSRTVQTKTRSKPPMKNSGKHKRPPTKSQSTDAKPDVQTNQDTQRRCHTFTTFKLEEHWPQVTDKRRQTNHCHNAVTQVILILKCLRQPHC